MSGLLKKSECQMDITLDWTNHVGQQIYATSVVRQMLRYAPIAEFLFNSAFRRSRLLCSGVADRVMFAAMVRDK